MAIEMAKEQCVPLTAIILHLEVIMGNRQLMNWRHNCVRPVFHPEMSVKCGRKQIKDTWVQVPPCPLRHPR